MNGRSWKDPQNSAHCAEIYENNPILQYHVGCDFHRILKDSHPAQDYQSTRDKKKSTIHWGQRKLLLSEIEFLTIIGRENLADSIIVYAGAAPGTHVKVLSELFPETKFILIDPAPFTVRPSRNIFILNQMFTNSMARRLSAQYDKIYFICDIRTAAPDQDTYQECEALIKIDMANQMKWHILLHAQRSILKFRLPWDDGRSIYLDGEIYLPVWGPQKTTECRLITGIDPRKMRQYDHKLIESQMFYFCTVLRHSLYSHPIIGGFLDHCYDCTAEIHILDSYLTEFLPTCRKKIKKRITAYSEYISSQISHSRTLGDPNPDPGTKLAIIHNRQRPEGKRAYK